MHCWWFGLFSCVPLQLLVEDRADLDFPKNDRVKFREIM